MDKLPAPDCVVRVRHLSGQFDESPMPVRTITEATRLCQHYIALGVDCYVTEGSTRYFYDGFKDAQQAWKASYRKHEPDRVDVME